MINDVAIPLKSIRKATRETPKGNKTSRDALVKIIKQKQAYHLIERMHTLSRNGKYMNQNRFNLAVIPFLSGPIRYVLFSLRNIR